MDVEGIAVGHPDGEEQLLVKIGGEWYLLDEVVIPPGTEPCSDGPPDDCDGWEPRPAHWLWRPGKGRTLYFSDAWLSDITKDPNATVSLDVCDVGVGVKVHFTPTLKDLDPQFIPRIAPGSVFLHDHNWSEGFSYDDDDKQS